MSNEKLPTEYGGLDDVIRLYLALHTMFRDLLGAQTSPDHTIRTSEQYPSLPSEPQDDNLGSLLPSSDGWAYSPLWGSPRPIGKGFQFRHEEQEWTNEEMRDTLLLLNSDDANCLNEITWRVYHRAWCYRIDRRAKSILKQAISKAKSDIVELKKGGSAITTFTSSARLQWLELWQAADIPRQRFAAAELVRLGAGGRTEKADRIVTPEDMSDAYERLVRRVREAGCNLENKRQEERIYSLLGLWYKHRLLECGLTQDEIQQRLYGKRSQTPRSWADIVKRTVQNYEQNRPDDE